MQSKWREVRHILERALEEHPADLTTWLAEATDDAEVREEVRSLLDQHTEAGEFLTQPVQDRFPVLGEEEDAVTDDRILPDGHVILHYTIVRLIGGGGMGRVYLATDGKLRRKVALKAIAARFTGDPAYKERLRNEAQLAGGLNHPGICTVYAFEEYEGDVFIVTEYVDGHTLDEEIAAGPTPASAVQSTGRDIAEALASAHAQGVVHRDLKPENVMRSRDGRLKILDFGIARADHPDAGPDAILKTHTGVLVGTLTYMAPERLNGQSGDARSDVFSFGVMLYELASGVHPFKGESVADVIARILYTDVVPIESRCPDLPKSVCSVIDRCLQKSPAQRYQSAAEIWVELRASPVLVTLPSVPPAPSLPAPIPPGPLRWWRAHQVIVIGLYFLACVSAWLTKEGLGQAAMLFSMVTTAATVGGVLRGHLLFVERVNPRAFAAERRRTNAITLWTDALIAAALVVDGTFLSIATRHVAAALVVALGIGVLLARLRIEPASADEAFGAPALH